MNFNEEQEKNMLYVYVTYENYYRSLRIPILKAFDIYKSNVQYGINIETAEEHTLILEWYEKVLNLEIDSILNIPTQIKKYL